MNNQNLILSILLLNLFSFITIMMRPKLFKVKLYTPMITNFKLSLLPFAVILGNSFVCVMLLYFSARFSFLRIVAILLYLIGLIIWLLLLPNSGYLITELNLNHRDIEDVEVPIWYDIVSILSFALSGIVNTLGNVVIIQLTYLVYFDPSNITSNIRLLLLLSALLLNVLVSIGVYFGRYIRFNSWDVIKLSRFVSKMTTHFKEKGALRNFGLFILLHTVFFMIIYVMLGIPFCWQMWVIKRRW